MRWALILVAVFVQVAGPGRLTGVNLVTTITVPTSATTYDAGTASTLTISGTAASDRIINVCTWVNSLGGSGTATGLNSWTIASAALTVGANVFTVTCLNTEGTSAQDIITVTRSSGVVTGSSYTSGFPATENPMVDSSNWTQGLSTGLDWKNVRTTTNLAFGTQTGSGGFDDSTALVTNLSSLTDQYAQGMVFTTSQSDTVIEEIALRLRSTMAAHSNTGYECIFNARSNANAYIQIVKWNGAFGAFTLLDARAGATYGILTGDVVRCEVIGNRITQYINGVSKLSVTDNTYTAGSPGMGFYLQNGTSAVNPNYGITKFWAGPLTQRTCTSTVAATQAAILAAITAASSTVASVICVSDGAYTQTAGISIAKPVTLKTVNRAGVTITNNAGANLFNLTMSANGSVEVAGFTFEGGTTAGTSGAHVIQINRTAGALPALIHDNLFHTNANAVGGIRIEDNSGVIWGNVFDYSSSTSAGQATDVEGIQFKAQTLAATWLAASKFGAADTTGQEHVFAEDNVFKYVRLQSYDCDDSARINMRYNAFNNSGGTSHGSDTSPEGCREADFNNNAFVFTDFGDSGGTLTQNVDYLILPRGGVWSIWGNVIPNVTSTAWGNKSETKIEIQNLRRAPCWTGGYPSRHQFGQGGNGAAQITEAVYFWLNTGAGDYNAPGLVDYAPDECGGGPAITTFVQSGRDYFTSTTRPSYTAYAWPHPLRTGK